ncbi:ABC transporter substrate-binding protein [Paracoccus saliphilus]|uniref:ABC transporter substrate-binding protein n=1 Tax=Paracoccus saliphilus TaxID=405559 RepID=A0AA45W7K5_9RHOB|nr:ABC transporter substrate-binding protein [Paracoccus saliphilus]WCR03071.1 ABC transporter substrate-binding protein [Paracoccus saliphilus]SIT10433.1 monosaccharide ABC transporter substrate-binding protein, CUT2 family [Paracoccus saliphilus]
MKRRSLMKAAALTAVMGLTAGVALAQDEAEKKVIGVSIPSATHGFMGGLNWHAQDTIERMGETYPNLEFVLATAGDAAKQVSDIEDMMATRNIDGLVVLPFESEPLTGPVASVKEAGKFVTVVDRGLSQDGIEDLYVAGDNAAFGRVAGEYFSENLEAGSKIVVLRGIPTTLDNERVEAFQAALEGSDIEILDMEHGNWNRDDAFTVMQDFLSKYPEINAVWAADDDMAIGVLEAIAAAGREDEMWVIGGAGMKEIVKRIMDGDPQLPVNVTYPPALISSAIEMTALNFVSNAPMTGRFIIGSQLITPENAEQFHFPDSPF